MKPARHSSALRRSAFSAALALLLLSEACATGAGASTGQHPSRPRLAVVVVIDQFRAEDIERLRPLYGPGGLAGVSDGIAAASMIARYGHACTETSPGHATLSTGAAPSEHGIVVNNWFVGRQRHYAVADPEHGRSATNLLAPTLGDSLKRATDGKGKVAAVSIKDRGAILSAGRTADVALWFSPAQMKYVTSSAYPDTPLALQVQVEPKDFDVVASVASSKLADADQADLIHPPPGWGPGLPLRMADVPKSARGWAYRMTPASAEQLLDLAVLTRSALALGADDTPDLLIVSVSTPDYAGHAYGPHSPQYVSVMVELDPLLRRFRDRIEAAVGPGRVVWALAGDHGAGPAPQRLKRWSKPGGTILMQDVARAAEAAAMALEGKNPGGAWVVAVEPPHLYLDLQALPIARRHTVQQAVAKALRSVPGIRLTFLPEDPPNPEDPAEVAARQCTRAGRNGQVMMVQKQGWMFDDLQSPGAANHGSPYTYDQEVPLILWGPGIRPGRHDARVDPRDLAPTLAKLLGIRPPDKAQGRVLTEALR